MNTFAAENKDMKNYDRGSYPERSISSNPPTKVTITDGLKTLEKELHILNDAIKQLDNATKSVQIYRDEKPQDNRVSPVPVNMFDFVNELISRTRNMQASLEELFGKLNI